MIVFAVTLWYCVSVCRCSVNVFCVPVTVVLWSVCRYALIVFCSGSGVFSVCVQVLGERVLCAGDGRPGAARLRQFRYQLGQRQGEGTISFPLKERQRVVEMR